MLRYIINLWTIVSCHKKEDNIHSLRTTVDDTTADIHETISNIETTAEQGLIPNTADIVIREGVKPLYALGVDITVRTDIPEEERGLGAAIEESYYAYEDAKRLGVSKILVMQLDNAPIYMPEKEIFSKINELLVTKYGCDFVVSFVGLNPFVCEYYLDGDITSNNYIWIHEYDDNLKYMKENKQQVDIITSVQSVMDYSTLVMEGYLEDITDYLMTTEEGGKLYNAFPKETWDAITKSGRIYGYSKGSMYMNFEEGISVWALNCNKAVAQKFGIEINGEK